MKYTNHLLFIALLGLSGCFETSHEIQVCIGEHCTSEPEGENNGQGGGTPSPPPDLKEYSATLVTADIAIYGDVFCNGQQIAKDGTFRVNENEVFNCQFGNINLAEFTAPPSVIANNSSPVLAQLSDLSTSFDLEAEHGKNVTAVLQSIDSCLNEKAICLKEINSFDIQDIFAQLDNNAAVNDFLAVKNEEATDDVGHAPSSHIDNDLVPAITPGASNNLNSSFVSANAEASLAYQPEGAEKVLTKAILTDANEVPLVGIDFYSENAIGRTDENGAFEFLWGDELTFGISTFSFGSLKGNQLQIKLSDVSTNPTVQSNIQSLLLRYIPRQDERLTVPEKVRNVFSNYPNSINTLINLSLPNGGMIAGTQFATPDEFKAQFEVGQTKTIDEQLQLPGIIGRQYPQMYFVSTKTGEVTQALTQIFNGVSLFHIFNDNQGYYGATGYSRGMRALNLSNRAFPIMMPRVDINYRIPFGEPMAWTREGKPYIVKSPGVVMPPVPKVSKDNAVFGFPFVTAGRIGNGKIVYMGNNMYPSILSCPDTYWGSRYLSINSQEKRCALSEGVPLALDDKGSMKRYFTNLFTWLSPQYAAANSSVGTNITKGMAAVAYREGGLAYDFFVHPSYSFANTIELTSGGYASLEPANMPILLLQAYETQSLHFTQTGTTGTVEANISKPKLTEDDITALIQYVSKGGNIIFMEAISPLNPAPIARLVDAAGFSVGGQNMTPTNQLYCGSSYYCQAPSPNLSVRGEFDIVVIQQMGDVNAKPPYTVGDDGEVTWVPPADMPPFIIPSYEVKELDANSQETGKVQKKQALISVKNASEKDAAIKELQRYFPNTQLCENAYEYEINCIEVRKGNQITMLGAYGRRIFDRYQVSPDVITSMIKSANLGGNLEALYRHELYYRSRGRLGERLSSADLNQRFDSLSVWFWNDNQYVYDPDLLDDELGFKQVATFLNCYTNNRHQASEAVACHTELKNQLIEQGMIYGEGELAGQLNPSYPLNYMEKPLTRIMLGRSYWDLDIKVDVSAYPGRYQGSLSSGQAVIKTGGTAVIGTANNNQATGFWAPQLSPVRVQGGVPATITVMMADDLTSLPKHELALNRPPRMQKTFSHDGSFTEFIVPYGGLISIQPNAPAGAVQSTATFSLSGVGKAPFWQEGLWVHGIEQTAPMAIIDTGSMLYVTASNNLKQTDLTQFANDINRFTEAANDFYGRDETTPTGLHRKFTYPALAGFRHRFFNDVQISIGAAHSGYPVMNTGFTPNASEVPTNPVDDWLLWHEFGHNFASAPFSIQGSTEVSNNLLGLYMQELKGRNPAPEMDRIRTSIQKAPLWLRDNHQHAWSHGNAAMRLVMFGQLKVWAESAFNIDAWYANSLVKPAIYNEDQGWNLFKLMHRKARGDNIGDKGINYCNANDTQLAPSDLLLVCTSYISGYDLSDFFIAWMPGEGSSTSPDGVKQYFGGITSAGLNTVKTLNLKKPLLDPLSINKLP